MLEPVRSCDDSFCDHRFSRGWSDPWRSPFPIEQDRRRVKRGSSQAIYPAAHADDVRAARVGHRRVRCGHAGVGPADRSEPTTARNA